MYIPNIFFVLGASNLTGNASLQLSIQRIYESQSLLITNLSCPLMKQSPPQLLLAVSVIGQLYLISSYSFYVICLQTRGRPLFFVEFAVWFSLHTFLSLPFIWHANDMSCPPPYQVQNHFYRFSLPFCSIHISAIFLGSLIDILAYSIPKSNSHH